MRIAWSLPVRGERADSSRGDLVRARRLAAALRADGHQVHLVEAAASPGGALAVRLYRDEVRRALPRGVALALRDLGRFLHGRAHGRRLAAAARAQGAELIVETQVHYAPSGAIAARACGIPLVLDDCSPAAEERTWGTGLPALARHVLRRQALAAARVVVSSSAARSWLLDEGVPADRLAVVPNGVDLDAFARADGGRARQRHVPGRRCVLGFVGSFQPWHRAGMLVEALARLDDPGAHVLFVGEGPGLEPALALARRLGVGSQVTAVGAVAETEVPALVSAFDVGVLPGSNPYGQPMKLVEYAAAARPAVAPDLAPVREVVTEGVTALLFPPGEVGALAGALGRLARDERLRQRLGEDARRRLPADAGWQARARALVAGLGPAAQARG